MDIQIVTRKVDGLRKKVADAEQDRARAEGSLQTITDRLKTEFGCESLEAAGVKLAELDSAITDYDNKIADLVAQLEEAMNANPA